MSLERAIIEKYSGSDQRPLKGIPHLKLRQCRVLSQTVAGDAPKDLLAIYDHESGIIRQNRPHSWPVYIAKVGQKWYPSESITEYALNQIGERIGLTMASSRLMYVRGQLRFLSLNFRKHDEILDHGAQILAGYLGDDEFVEFVEAKGESRNLFTFQVVMASLKQLYEKESDELILSFVRLLAFDAMIGNNDRHMYNWGVLRNVKTGQTRFAPIFDTARALHWNKSDKAIDEIISRPNSQPALSKYVSESKPKTGWDGVPEIGHIELIQLMLNDFPEYDETIRLVLNIENFDIAQQVLDREISHMISPNRLTIMKLTLGARLDAFKKLGIL